jgi:putative nucleotidyltransferase with HDIG domain
MDREEALKLVKEKVKNQNLVKHMLACEAVLKKLANYFGQDEEEWGLAGLLHDLDYDLTFDKPEKHSLITAEWLTELGVNEDIIKAVKAHSGKAPLDDLLSQALYATDPTTGFLVACALMTPEKKMAAVDVGFALRRFKEKSFARGANREQMKSCESFGMRLEDFLKLAIEAMQEISGDLSL